MELKAALVDAVVKMEQRKKEIVGLKLANEGLIAGNSTKAQKSGMARLWIFSFLASVVAGAVFMRLCLEMVLVTSSGVNDLAECLNF